MPKTPYIGCTGEDVISVSDFTIIVERQPIVTLKDFRKAIIALIACYYAFNIQYSCIFIIIQLNNIVIGSYASI